MTSTSNEKSEIIRTERGLTIAGTRITLYDVMDYVTAQYPARYTRNMLNLTDEQINAALSYIEKNRAQVEAEYQKVLQEAEEIRQYWEDRNRERLAQIRALPPKPGQERQAWNDPMNFLIDHNLEGYAVQLLGTLASQGWLEMLSIRFLMFHEAELADDSSDRIVWRFAQENQMILLTANRRMKGVDNLEQTIREENTTSSLPVLTIASLDRFNDREYREKCAVRLIDILLDIENYKGVGRIFIP
jgi:uncharacterized protein (DUF433 family)